MNGLVSVFVCLVSYLRVVLTIMSSVYPFHRLADDTIAIINNGKIDRHTEEWMQPSVISERIGKSFQKAASDRLSTQMVCMVSVHAFFIKLHQTTPHTDTVLNK